MGSGYSRSAGVDAIVRLNLLVMFGDATLTPLAVLASQRCPDHARYTKVRLVEFPHSQQLLNNGLLLGNAIEFGDESRIENHRRRIEVCRDPVKNNEEEIEKPMASSKGIYYHWSAYSMSGKTG